ncbi:MAG: THUMP domain-containing protein [Thermoproteota archaeon]
MEEEANLLVTFDSENLPVARYEVKDTLEEVGEEEPRFLSSRVHGLFMLQVDLDPKVATKRLNGLCREDPSLFGYTYHWIPVEKWCKATIKEMSKIVKEYAERIKPGDKWRMRINKRFYEEYHTRELIEELTKHVDKPNVDLENPDKTIRIEIIGGKAAISLLKPEEHFSVNDVKAEILTKE